MLLDPSRKISPKEKFDRAESLEECSRVSAALGESRTLGAKRYFKRLQGRLSKEIVNISRRHLTQHGEHN